MRCMVCKLADTIAGATTVTLQRGEATLVVNDVPAQVGPNCGEDHVASEVAAELMRSPEALVRAGTQIDVRRYAVAA